MTTAITPHDKIFYKRNFIDQVIVRVDFLSPLTGIESNIPTKLSQSILASFPIAEPRQATAQEVLIDSSQNFTATRSQFTKWHFHGRNREKTFVVLPTAIFVTYASYNNYESVRDEFISLLGVCFDLFKDAQPSRLGLRYINKIHFPDGDPLDWRDYIESSMLSLFAFPQDKAKLSRIFHILEYAFEEFNIRYQFGMNNPDFPAPIRQRIFVLDMDAYHQGAITPAEIGAALDKYHGSIQDLFEQSITDGLRRVMHE